MLKILVAMFLLASCTVKPQTIVVKTGEMYGIADRLEMYLLEKKSVRINYVCGMVNKGKIGSGVVIEHKNGKTLVATAAHVTKAIAKKDCDIVAFDWRGRSGFAKVVKTNERTDISVIEVGEIIGEAAGLFNNPYLGQPVTCVGWPRLPFKNKLRKSITRGHVSTLVDGYLRVSADLYFGNSGGACYSKDGKVVGIVSHFTVGGAYLWNSIPFPGQYFISHVKNLKKLLD